MKLSTIIGILILVTIIAVGVWVHLTAIGAFKAAPVVEIQPVSSTNGTLRVVTDADYWPYSFIDKDGNVSGREVEIANAIANLLGMNIELKAMKWSECLELAGTHTVDMVLTCAEYSTECETDDLTSSLPLGSDDYMVFGKKPLKALNELHGRRLAQLNYGNVNPTLRAAGFGSEMKLYPSHREAFMAIENGEADYTVIRYSPAIGILKDLGITDIKPQCSAGKSFFCIGINKHRPGLVNKVNDAIMVLRVNGEMNRLSEKWLTTYVKPDSIGEVVMNHQKVFFAFLVITALFIIALYCFACERSRVAGKLRESNKAKTEFLFNMSHDIRTPMNAINGFTEIARECIDDKERVRDCLDKIGQSGGLLLSLINGVLDMSRVEAGKAKLEEVECDIMESFRSIETTMGELAKAKGLTLSFSYGNITDRYVYADKNRCSRVFVNIISNAIKYSKPNGYVKILCEQSGEKKNGVATYRYTFEDNGIGMSEEFLGHVFDEFAREKNSTTSGIQGTGLGMALSKSFVDLMGGTITCKSEQNIGTEFVVELPFKVMRKAEKEKSDETVSADMLNASNHADSFAGKRVLLVEDNELNREVATFALTEHGFEVEIAEDGSVAVRLVKEKGHEYYDYILMDIQMPIMGGYEAARVIREWERNLKIQSSEFNVQGGTFEHTSSQPVPHIPIIALSANAFAEDKAASLAAGMDAHVAKPIDVKMLFCVLRSLSKKGFI